VATFQVRVEDYTGTIGDTAALSDWLTEGARIMVDRFKPERLELDATDKTDAGGDAGVSIVDGRALFAHKSNYPARRISVAEKGGATASGSIHFAETKSPVWFTSNTKGFVYPSGGTIVWFAYPTVLFGDSTITAFPAEGYAAVVLYAAVQGELRLISDLIDTTMTAISFTFPTEPSAASAPSFTFTSPTSAASYTNIETALTNKDPELAAAEGGKLNLQIQEYGTDIQDQLAVYKEAVDEYQGTLGKFNADLASYAAQVTEEVQRVSTLIQQYVAQYQGYFEILKNIREWCCLRE